MNPQPQNKSTREFLRARNRYLVVNAINTQGPISRQEIIRATGIRPATVIRTVEKLIEENFVKEVGHGKSTGGRKPILLELNPKAKFVVGVHLWESKILSIIADLRGNIITRLKRNHLFSTKRDLVSFMLKSIRDVVKQSGIPKDKIIGVGLSVPGLVDTKKGVSLFCDYHPWWRNICFKEIVEKEFHIPTYVENDTRALTLAEKWFGWGKEIKNFLYLDAGEGIAVGIFLNGNLYRGTGGSAGELGHTIIDKDCLLCKCSNYRRLETLSSTIAIKNKVKRLLKEGAKSLLTEETTIEKLNFSDIVRATKRGDELSLQVMEELGKHLGIEVANLVDILNPSLIIVGGLIARAGEIILNPIANTLEECALSKPAHEVDIKLTQLDESAGALGSTTPALEKFLKPLNV